MLHATGYSPDTHDLSRDPLTSALFGSSQHMPVPSHYSMRSVFAGEGGLGVEHQGVAEACVGYALVECLEGRARANRVALPRLSHHAVWTHARLAMNELTGEGVESLPLANVGVVPLFAAQGLSRWGVPTLADWPDDPARMNELPTLDQDERASALRVTGWHRILSVGPQRLADVRVAVSSNCMVAVGLSIDQAFDEYAGGVLAPTDMGKVVGRHMVPILGYDGDGLLEGLNHWGKDWGEGGFFTASSDWLLSPAVTDLIVVTGEIATAP